MEIVLPTKIITQNELKELFDYNSETGIFIRKKRTAMRQKIGEIVGVNCRKGYLKCGIYNKEYYLHRLAWLYVYGYYPDKIDHINHNKKDNRILNLREVDNTENLRNMTRSKANTSGITGVSYSKREKKWVSQICYENKRIAKRFKTKEEAIKQREEWNRIYKFHKNHGGEKNETNNRITYIY